MKISRHSVVALLLWVASFFGHVLGQTDDIVDLAAGDPELSTLVSLIGADLENTLRSGTYTVFAPTNEAFDDLPSSTLTYLAGNQAALEDVLTYHVLSGETFSDDIDPFSSATTVQGEDVEFTVLWRWSWDEWWFVKSIFVNNAKVEEADLEATNGVVHKINKVLLPESALKDITDTAKETDDLSTLSLLLHKTDLDETLKGDGPFTVLAPTNDAFLDLDADLLAYLLFNEDDLKEILLYHVIEGATRAEDIVAAAGSEITTPTVNGAEVTLTASGTPTVVTINSGDATVTTANVEATNGVVHIIDAVLIPPTYNLRKNIVDLATDNGLTTLVTALTQVELDGALSGAGSFTVFAPTNQAFVDAGIDLAATDDDTLREILLFHVVLARITAQRIIDHEPIRLATLNGSLIRLEVVNDEVVIEETATVVTPDVKATNGIVHVIDAVLMPPDEEECPRNNIFWCWWNGY